MNSEFKANKLSLNLTKTFFILFTSHRKILPTQSLPLEIDGIPIPQVSYIKFHGVVIDKNLTWKDHILQISIKLGKDIGILSRISYKVPAHTLINLPVYYSLVYPYIAYCNMVWASNYKTRLARLVIILQKRAVRLVTKSCYGCHTKELFSLHCILTIEQIRLLQTGIFMFCYKHDLLPKTFADYFNTGSASHSHYTRAASKYRTVFAHMNTRKFSVRVAGPTVWNNLPADITNVPFLHSFKKRLCAYVLTLNSRPLSFLLVYFILSFAIRQCLICNCLIYNVI